MVRHRFATCCPRSCAGCGCAELAIGGPRSTARWQSAGRAAFVALVKASIYLLMVAVIVQALLSWVAPHGPVAGVLNAITFRFLRPIRNVVPLVGGQLDLSPLILIVLCQLVLLLPVAWLAGAVAWRRRSRVGALRRRGRRAARVHAAAVYRTCRHPR
jgi:uncharacterized protein YggT (Ycf19 family)